MAFVRRLMDQSFSFLLISGKKPLSSRPRTIFPSSTSLGSTCPTFGFTRDTIRYIVLQASKFGATSNVAIRRNTLYEASASSALLNLRFFRKTSVTS